MKEKLFKAIDIFFESLYFLILTYTLSSMAISFNYDLFGLLCRVANIYAITQYYTSMKKLTGSTFWTYVLLFGNLVEILFSKYTLIHHFSRTDLKMVIAWIVVAIAWVIYLVGLIRQRRTVKETEPWNRKEKDPW